MRAGPCSQVAKTKTKTKTTKKVLTASQGVWCWNWILKDEQEFARRGHLRIFKAEATTYAKGGTAVYASPEMYKLNTQDCEVHVPGGVRVDRAAVGWSAYPLYQAKEFGLNSVGSRKPLKDLQPENVMI